MRLKKTVNGTAYDYCYNGNLLTHMSTSGWYAHIRYSAEGMSVHIQYKNGSNPADEYYYMFNAQGDVVGLLDGIGKLVVEYTYDAWGQPLTITGSMKDTLGKANPLRYRCYVYDEETGMYYLGSRYYNPVMGRFISADSINYLGANKDFASLNLFVYCGNNPVSRKDDGGKGWFLCVVAGLATQYVSDVIGNVQDGKTGLDLLKPRSSLGEYVAAGVTALIPGEGMVAAFTRNFVTEGITTTEKIIKGKPTNMIDSIVNVTLGTAIDGGVETVSSYVTKRIQSRAPRNYSTHAHEVRQSNPNATSQQIRRSMARSYRFYRNCAKITSVTLNIGRSCLPY